MAPEGPKAGPSLEGPDSMGRVDAERRRLALVGRPNQELRRGWCHLGLPLGQWDRLFLVTDHDDVEDDAAGDEEEEEEVTLGLEPQGRLCWSREAVSHWNLRWAHWSSLLAAAAAGEAAAVAAAAADEAAAAAAAAASRFESGEKLEPVGGS